MIEQHFKIQKTVRYFSIGEMSDNVKHVWFALHGYGQLAKYFSHHFRHFESEERLIVIPEGPHRFYLENTEGRVGASWMTKEDRLQDIEDYCSYLNSLKAEIIKSTPNAKVHIFGFSQGVATAFRWANNFVGNELASLHGWGGTFPQDIDYNLNQAKFNSLDLSVSFGDNDKYISKEQSNEMVLALKETGIQVKRHDYVGEHKLYENHLKVIFKTTEE